MTSISSTTPDLAPSKTPGAVDRLTGLLRSFEVEVSVIEAADPLPSARDYAERDAGGMAIGHLHVVSRGAVRLEAASGAPSAVLIEGPHLALLPGALPHRLVPVERPAVACAALRFTSGAGHPLVRALPPLMLIDTTAVAGLDATLGLLAAETEQVRCGQPLIASRLLEVVLLQVLRWVFDRPGDAGISSGLVRAMADPGVAAALTAVHEQPGARWTLEAMARTAAMSRSAFAARFQELSGQTAGAYVAAHRVALAQQGLRRGEQIAGLAAELGYANGSGLSRAFRAQVGLSPSEWLARQTRQG